MKCTAINTILFFSLIMLVGVACDDDDSPTQPVDTEFNFRVEVTDSIGNPAAGLQVSAWNKLSGIAIQKSPAGESARTRLEGDPIAASIQAGQTGDINCNDIPYEIADMVMYANYFVEGLDAFTDEQCAVGASDVNPDGNALTISDLVCLIRIVNGDMAPPTQALDSIEAGVISSGLNRLRITSDTPIGAVRVKIAGRDTPTLVTPDMELQYYFHDSCTYALVYSPDGSSFTGDVLDLWWNREIVSVECAAHDGRQMVTTTAPIELVPRQNHPNPFNGTTTITLTTAVWIDYQFIIQDMEATSVLEANETIGPCQILAFWDASACRSGVYNCIWTVWAAGTDTLLLADTSAAVVHNMDADLDELGFTGTDGVFETTRRLYFPYLYDLPAMISTDANGILIGEFGFTDTMVVMLTDTSTSQSQTHEVVVGEKTNLIYLIWDPIM